MGRAWQEYLLPTYHAFGIAEAMVEDTGKSVSDVTLLLYSYDYIDNPTPWNESMRRMAQEIAPKLPRAAFATTEA